jgi:hypothetical protein
VREICHGNALEECAGVALEMSWMRLADDYRPLRRSRDAEVRENRDFRGSKYRE